MEWLPCAPRSAMHDLPSGSGPLAGPCGLLRLFCSLDCPCGLLRLFRIAWGLCSWSDFRECSSMAPVIYQNCTKACFIPVRLPESLEILQEHTAFSHTLPKSHKSTPCSCSNFGGSMKDALENSCWMLGMLPETLCHITSDTHVIDSPSPV